MSDLKVVFESPRWWHWSVIQYYLLRGIPVWVVEPFHAYHHSKTKVLWFPDFLPEYVEKLINEGRISVIRPGEIDPKHLKTISGTLAIESIEAVYPAYQKKFKRIVDFACRVMGTREAEDIFRKILCDGLCIFYSANTFIHRVAERFGPGPIIFYPEVNVLDYRFKKELLDRSRQKYFPHPQVRFSFPSLAASFLEFFNLKERILPLIMLWGQTVASHFLKSGDLARGIHKKSYKYGVTIRTGRQLRGTQRGPDFIVDNEKIKEDELLFFLTRRVSRSEKQKLAQTFSGKLFSVPRRGEFFSNPAEWRELFWLSIREQFLWNTEEVKAVSLVIFSYFKWKKTLEAVKIEHFITHSDFGVDHIGRNAALKQAGVKTWYFIDSMNNLAYLTSRDYQPHEPLFTYLHYDNFVTWSQHLADYLRSHCNPSQYHVLGCLWANHIKKNPGKQFTIAVYDTTYTTKGFAAYEEGIAFARDILRLAERQKDIMILFKEKKTRALSLLLEKHLAPQLIGLYQQMEKHPRIKMFSNADDASAIMAQSHLIVSFPFASTTFEAMSACLPAIWHDPAGLYKNTHFAQIKGVVTHNYEQLEEIVLSFKNNRSAKYESPFPKGSPFMDPYRDGKAIERFRELLVSGSAPGPKIP